MSVKIIKNFSLFLILIGGISGCVCSENDLPAANLVDDNRIEGLYFSEIGGNRSDIRIEKVHGQKGLYKQTEFDSEGNIRPPGSILIKLFKVGDLLIASTKLVNEKYGFSKVGITGNKITSQPLNQNWFKRNPGVLAIKPNTDKLNTSILLTANSEKLALFFRLKGDDGNIFLSEASMIQRAK
jgi:hypothetical protein